jgi:hypothetical protein
MPLVSEQSLQSWASAPGETENEKCDNAVTGIRKAIDSDATLSRHTIGVFAQGSYRNRTNVRQDSDVDVCVSCRDTIFYDLPVGYSALDFNLSTPPTYGYAQFKNDVGDALTSYFADGHVTRGHKAFDIKENTYRIAADAVPCFVYKNFCYDPPLEGVGFVTDGPGAKRIVNWPEQNYRNGVEKNTASGTRFKDVARILKRLCYKMKDENVAGTDCIPSFLLECLAYNVPNETLQLDTYLSIVRASLLFLYGGTKNAADCAQWKEVNEQKALFDAGQVWTSTLANTFVAAAWNYLGFR